MSQPAVHGLDHAVVIVGDLETAAASFARLGFRVSERHVQDTAGYANHTITFQQEYIELLTVAADSPNQFLVESLKQGDGLRMIALASEDAAADMTRMQAQGVQAHGPFSFGRAATLRDGREVEVAFTVVMPQPIAPPGEAAMFLCQQHNPEYVFEPEAPAHPNGASRVLEIHVPVVSVEAVASRAEVLFGLQAIRSEPDAIQVSTGSTLLRFVQRAAWNDASATGRLVIGSVDMSSTRRWFEELGMSFDPDDEVIRIAPSEACAVELEFRPG